MEADRCKGLVCEQCRSDPHSHLHHVSQVLLRVLRTAKRYVSPACILSPEQLVPPGHDFSYINNHDPNKNADPSASVSHSSSR